MNDFTAQQYDTKMKNDSFDKVKWESYTQTSFFIPPSFFFFFGADRIFHLSPHISKKVSIHQRTETPSKAKGMINAINLQN